MDTLIELYPICAHAQAAPVMGSSIGELRIGLFIMSGGELMVGPSPIMRGVAEEIEWWGRAGSPTTISSSIYGSEAYDSGKP